jgi:hypothetical protein
VKEANRIGKRVFDQHSPGIASDQLLGGSPMLVRQEHGRFIVSELLDIELPKVPSGQTDGLFIDAGSPVLSGGYIQLDNPPGGTRQKHNLLQDLRGPAPQRDEGDTHPVQPCQMGVGGQSRVKYQMARKLTMRPFPEGDESEDFFRLLSLAQIGIRVTGGPALGVLGQEDQQARLAPAAGGNVMTLDHRIFAVILESGVKT